MAEKRETVNKIHKFTVYAYGFNDMRLAPAAELEEAISSTRLDFIIQPFHENTVVVEEIGDDHPINKTPYTKETWERYMDDELQILYKNKLKADRELNEYKKKKGLE